MRFIVVLAALSLLISCSRSQLGSSPVQQKRTFAVMAPLQMGPQDKKWDEFKRQLKEMKAIGVESVTTDIWWGEVEKAEGVFTWGSYHELAKAIIGAGLRWVPILSTHQCGGNVGDDCSVPIPDWIWARRFGPHLGTAFQYVSEYGNSSKEVISVWGTPWALSLYKRFYEAFRKEFEPYAKNMAEVNISLGASGELRYPSYNAHDGAIAGYPTRGAVQAYSPLAKNRFQVAMQKKYGSLENLVRAWNFKVAKWEDIAPALLEGGGAAAKTNYGKDFFDWYQDSLIAHGRSLLDVAEAAFHAPGSAYSTVPIGAKVPGIHWRMSTDRLAELSAGMIRTSVDWTAEGTGHGYAPLLSVFQTRPGATTPVILHFSCLEKSDGDDAPRGKSLAKSLVQWVGAEAARQKVILKGENALSWSLDKDEAWNNLKDALASPYYSGLTLLRMSDVSSANAFQHRKFKSLVETFSR